MIIAKWVSFGIIVAIILIALIVELSVPSSFGTTTVFSCIPSAIIAAVVDFKWFLPLIELVIAILLWLLIYFLMLKFFKVNYKTNKHFKKVDYDDLLKLNSTILLKTTSNLKGKKEFGEIKIDDKTYLVLPANSETQILANQTVKVEYIKGNVCYVKEVI